MTRPAVLQVIALVCVIAAAGVLMYWNRRPVARIGAYDDLHLQCTACANPFVMSAAKVGAIRGQAGDPRLKMKCPRCGKDAEEMIPCEHCGQFYLAKTGPAGAKCPHCGFDPQTATR